METTVKIKLNFSQKEKEQLVKTLIAMYWKNNDYTSIWKMKTKDYLLQIAKDNGLKSILELDDALTN